MVSSRAAASVAQSAVEAGGRNAGDAASAGASSSRRLNFGGGFFRKKPKLDGPSGRSLDEADGLAKNAGEADGLAKNAGEADGLAKNLDEGAENADEAAEAGADVGAEVAEGVTKKGVKWKKTKAGVVALVAGGITAAIIVDTNTQKKAKGVCEYCCEESTTEGSKWEGNESPKECYNYVRENPDEFPNVITSEESKSIPEYPHDDDFPTKDPNLQKCVSCYTQCEPLYYFWDEFQGVTIDSFGPDTTNTVSEATEAELDAVLKIQANSKILANIANPR